MHLSVLGGGNTIPFITRSGGGQLCAQNRQKPQHVPILSHEKLYDNKIFPSSSIQQTSAVEELAVAVARPTTSGMRRETRKELWIRAGYPDTEQESIVGVEVKEEEDGQ